MRKIKIQNKFIGPGLPPFIIAEAGVNHNGQLALALKLIDAAAYAGADAIKFQTFKAHQVVIPETAMATYQQRNLKNTISQYEMLKSYELSKQEFKKILTRCKKRKILFLSTPHGGIESAKLLKRMKLAAYKFGSGDLTNTPLLQHIAKYGKPMLISTGMSTIKEVKTAVRTIERAGNKQIVILHATTEYPCPEEEINLRAIKTLQDAFPYPIGYSDHSEGILIPVVATALGATMIEKHFTLDKKLKGPDHKASITPHELSELIKNIRKIHVALGTGKKLPTKNEQKIKKVIRKSIVTSRVIKKGKYFTEKNINIRRPGTGIPPSEYQKILGKKAKKDIKKDTLLSRSHYG